MAIESLDEVADYKAYKALAALPNLTPSYERKLVGTTWNSDKKAGEIGPAAPLVKGYSPVFGEMHCRMRISGGLCGTKFKGRGALEHHLKADHKVILEATKKGRPFGHTIIIAKDFYTAIMKLHRIQALEQLCAGGKAQYKTIDVAEDSGLEDEFADSRHPETYRVLAAIEQLKPRKNADLANAPGRKSIKRPLTVAQRKLVEQLLDASPCTEYNSRTVARHCDPKKQDNILEDDEGLPLRPMKLVKNKWSLNKTAAIKIMKFLGLTLGPCDECLKSVPEGGKPIGNCQFVKNCASSNDFSKIEYKPGSNQWEEIMGRRLLLGYEDRHTEV